MHWILAKSCASVECDDLIYGWFGLIHSLMMPLELRNELRQPTEGRREKSLAISSAYLMMYQVLAFDQSVGSACMKWYTKSVPFWRSEVYQDDSNQLPKFHCHSESS